MVGEVQVWSALGAGVGLGVEASVGGVVVFRLAGGAHFEGGHGGVGAIVGDGFNNGVSRSAISAVDKGIAKASVGGIKQFGETIGAGVGVGSDLGFLFGLGAAGFDDETLLGAGGKYVGFYFGDSSKGGQFAFEPMGELV